MARVLDGIRVLDAAQYKAGPVCGALLADMGAEVIRIESPRGGDDRELGPFAPNGESMYLVFTSRNKKGVTLNLRSEKGKEIFRGLARCSDVVIENFGLAAKESSHLNYQNLREVNPRIIWAAVSGFGQTGPYARRLCFDPVAQAIAGIMHINGFPGEPVKTGVNIVDLTTPVYAAYGIVLALYHREKTGVGQEVDLALLDVAVTFMESVFAEYEVLGEVRPQLGNRNNFLYPFDSFKAKDGLVYIGTGGDAMWLRFLKLIGREDVARDPRFTKGHCRMKNWEPIAAMTHEWTADKTVDDVIKLCNEAEIPCGRVNTVPEAAADPQIQAREMIVDVEQPGIGRVPVTGIPVKLSETPGQIDTHAPRLGEHNEEIYCGLLGYDQQELSRLKEEGVI